jgi:hypothetical protein
MKVGQLISKLKEFNSDMEVLITDGYNYTFYRGDFVLAEFEDNGKTYVDIGIGGCMEESE